MPLKRRLLVGLALIGWMGTLLSQVAVLLATDEETARGWEERRNRFLLLASLSTNTLVFTTLYSIATGLRRRVT